MRLAFLGITALLATVAIQTPAFAVDPDPHRHESSTASSVSASKVHTVSCGGNEVLLGMGARVHTPAGIGVVLTSVVPDTDSHTVTATAHARPGYAGSWSLQVYAVCDGTGQFDPQLIAQDSYAECPPGTILYGTGFDVEQKDGRAWAEQVVPDADLGGLTVVANGSTVSALGICAASMGSHYRIQKPNSTTAPKPLLEGEAYAWIFGAGAILPTGSYLTTLGINEDLDFARIEYATPPPIHFPGPLARANTDDDDEDATVFGTLIGWWYSVIEE